MFAHFQRTVNPSPFGIHRGIEYLFIAVLGGVVLPAAFFGAPGGVPLAAQLTVALLSAGMLLAGELLERVLFFAAMSAPRMPGVVG